MLIWISSYSVLHCITQIYPSYKWHFATLSRYVSHLSWVDCEKDKIISLRGKPKTLLQTNSLWKHVSYATNFKTSKYSEEVQLANEWMANAILEVRLWHWHYQVVKPYLVEMQKNIFLTSIEPVCYSMRNCSRNSFCYLLGFLLIQTLFSDNYN